VPRGDGENAEWGEGPRSRVVFSGGKRRRKKRKMEKRAAYDIKSPASRRKGDSDSTQGEGGTKGMGEGGKKSVQKNGDVSFPTACYRKKVCVARKKRGKKSRGGTAT